MSNDPFDPDTSSIVNHDTGQPFAQRTVSFFFGLGLALLLMGGFAGWFFSLSDDDVREAPPVETAAMVSIDESGVPDFATTKMTQGNENEQNGKDDGVIQNIVEGIFGGFNTKKGTVERRGDNNILPAAALDMSAQELRQEEMFDGKILDFEGKPAGDIKAMTRESNGDKNFVFTLDQSLTPADKPRTYSVPYNEIKVVQEKDIFFIQLSKEQTESLAKSLFEENASEETITLKKG